MKEITSMSLVEDFFGYKQEEDFDKLGIASNKDVDEEDVDCFTLLASISENELQLVREEEEACMRELMNRNARAERRRRNRNHKMSKRKFNAICLRYPRFTVYNMSVQDIITASSRVGKLMHEDSLYERGFSDRIKFRAIRKEDSNIRKQYCGYVNSDDFAKDIEMAVKEENVEFECFEDRFTESEKAIIAEAARLLRLAEWWLYDEAEYAENFRKRAFQLEQGTA